jgi:hypothetical protein
MLSTIRKGLSSSREEMEELLYSAVEPGASWLAQQDGPQWNREEELCLKKPWRWEGFSGVEQ